MAFVLSALLAACATKKSNNSSQTVAPAPVAPTTNSNGGNNSREGGQDLGGGDLYKGTAVSDLKLSQLVFDFQQNKNAIMNNLFELIKTKFISSLNTEGTPDLEIKNSLYEKLYKSKSTIFDVINKVSVDAKTNEFCKDKDGNIKDGSIYSGKENTICVSLVSLGDVYQDTLRNRFVALVAHEYSHLLGSSEVEAAYLQKMIVDDVKYEQILEYAKSKNQLGSEIMKSNAYMQALSNMVTPRPQRELINLLEEQLEQAALQAQSLYENKTINDVKLCQLTQELYLKIIELEKVYYKLDVMPHKHLKTAGYSPTTKLLGNNFETDIKTLKELSKKLVERWTLLMQ